jgi:hypothetical protein
MGGVQFDESAGMNPQQKKPTVSLVGLLVKWGLAKDEPFAEKILLVAILVIFFAVAFLFNTAQQATKVVPTSAPAGFSE